MNIRELGLISIFVISIALLIVELCVVWIVASVISNFLGLTGIVWWAFAIIIFLLINGILSKLR